MLGIGKSSTLTGRPEDKPTSPPTRLDVPPQPRRTPNSYHSDGENDAPCLARTGLQANLG